MPLFSKEQRGRPLVVTASTAAFLILWLLLENLTIVACCFPTVVLLVPCDWDSELCLTPWAFFSFLLRRL